LISPEQVEAIRQATEIVDLASGYLSLKQSGKNFVALCPFHRDSLPSFNVNPERQMYKCFGCQESGDVFSLVMGLENISFPEAVRMLADRSGIRLEEGTKSDTDRLNRLRIAEALAFACNQYQTVLHQKSDGETGRAYLRDRGITQDMAREWSLGFAPQQRDFLLPRARKAGFTTEILEAAGLCYPERDGMPRADRFSQRIMFPIYNTRDQVAGFGGRAVREDQKGKYVNSPEGPLFLKSKLLYGQDRVNRARRKNPDLRQAPIYVAEGYLDVMALHAAGLETSVAPLGTALTADHVRLLRPAGNTVVLVFDGDSAGIEATRRAILELVKQDVDVEVTRPQAGRDPFSIFQEEGRDALVATVSNTQQAYAFLLDLALAGRGDSVEGRAAAAVDLARIFGQTPNAMKEDGYIRKASFDLRTREEALRKVWMDQKDRSPRSIQSLQNFQDPERPARTVRGALEIQAERDLALALIGQPDLIPRAMAEAPLKNFVDDRIRTLVGVLYNLNEELGGELRTLEVGSVLARLQGEGEGADRGTFQLVTELVGEADQRLEMRTEGRIDRDRNPFEDLLEGYLDYLKRNEAQARRRRLTDGIHDALAASDTRTLFDHLSAITDLDRSRHRGRSGKTTEKTTENTTEKTTENVTGDQDPREDPPAELQDTRQVNPQDTQRGEPGSDRDEVNSISRSSST